MLCGIIAYAAALEHAIEHPDAAFEWRPRLALALGLLLFVGGMVPVMWRAQRRFLLVRALITIATAVVILMLPAAAPWLSLTIVLIGVAIIVSWEQREVSVHA